jgi:hypothetical protein
MHYQLWDAASANVIAVLQTEAEGLEIVRRLLADGWDAEHLTLGLDFDEGEEGDDDSLPPVQYGAALAERALSADVAGPLHRA